MPKSIFMRARSAAALIAPVIAAITLFTGLSFASTQYLVGQYRVNILTEPEAVRAGRESTIYFKFLDARDGAPLRGGSLSVTVARVTKATERYPATRTVLGTFDAKEADEFGNYAIRLTFPKKGSHTIEATVSAMGGERLDPPVFLGLPLEVAPASEHGAGLPLMFVLLVSITAVSIYIFHMRSKIAPANPHNSHNHHGFNLLEVPWIRSIFKSRYIQPSSQAVLLLVFAILLLLGIFDTQESGRNLSTIAIWTIWWGGIIFTFVLVGRLWCYACPMGAVSEWISRLVKPVRRFPAKLSNVWLANLSFLTLIWLDVQLGVVRNPMVTSFVLLSLFIIAASMAMVYQRRTFCKYVCPIGGLIGIYSTVSPVELRSQDLEVCRGHKRKDCYLGNENGFGCPMFEVLPKMDRNNFCNFCGECVSTCPHGNVTLRVRSFFTEAWTSKRKYLDEAALAVVLVGVSIFVSGDMLEPWAGWIQSAMDMFPSEALGIEYEYYTEMLTKTVLYFGTSIVLIPGLMLAASAASNGLAGAGNHGGLKKTFVTFGYMFIPVGLSMHLTHNTAHLLKEAKAIVPAAQRALNLYTPLNLGAPNWLLGRETFMEFSTIYFIQMVIFAAFYVLSLYAGYRIALNNYPTPRVAVRALIPMVLLSFFFMGINVYLLNLPMSTRHVH